MRAFGTWIDLHDVETRLVGTHAFPLIVRGAMIGALACGRPAGVEPFAPDEVDAIDALAHALATAIDVLRTAALEREVAHILEGNGSYDSLRAALASKSAGQLMALE
jgi:GAF domain-containing protein